MVPTVAHLSEAELEAAYVACRDVRRSRHLQTVHGGDKPGQWSVGVVLTRAE